MRYKRFFILLGLQCVCFSFVHAQFYRVYDYQPTEAGELEFVLWNSYLPKSDMSYNYFGESLSREGLWAHSFELEYGLSNRAAVAFYLDYEDPKEGSFKHVRTKGILFHYKLFEKGSRPVDISMYLEYIVHPKDYKDYDELEFRLILEKDFGPVTVDFNPIFEKKTSGSKVEEGLEFNYAVGVYYNNNEEGIFARKNFWIRPGLEFYGKMGEIAGFKDWDDQRHVIFPTLDIYVGNRFHWHAGVGIGLTGASDDITLKSIMSFVLMF